MEPRQEHVRSDRTVQRTSRTKNHVHAIAYIAKKTKNATTVLPLHCVYPPWARRQIPATRDARLAGADQSNDRAMTAIPKAAATNTAKPTRNDENSPMTPTNGAPMTKPM